MNFNNIFTLVLIFSIVAIAGGQISKLFLRIKLPLVTGLLLVGVLCGPFVLKIIPEGSHLELSFLRDISIAFIALAAGSELYLSELRNRLNSIKWMTAGQLTLIFILGSVIVFFISAQIPYMKNQPVHINLAISLLTATIFMTVSPASAIAVINELRAKGPFTQTVLGVTILKDFLVIILFGVVMSLSKTIINEISFDFISILLILIELILSFLAAFLLKIIIIYFLSARASKKLKILLLLISGFFTYQVSYWVRDYSEVITGTRIYLEPLLICIIGSFLITNFSRYRAEFLLIIQEISPVIYIIFFTYIGISIELNLLFLIWPIALVFFIIRVLAIMISSWIGVRLANDPPGFYRVAWMPHISQGPVALGLTTVVANQFPDWGFEFLTVIIGLIVLDHLLGDPLLKYSIRYVGEDRSKGKLHEHDGIRDALIFGYESQAIALARQLQTNGWRARIVTTDAGHEHAPANGIEIIHMDKVTIENLDKIGAGKSEAFVTLLTDDENLDICEMAFQKYGTKDMIVRLNERINFDKFHRLGALIVEPSTAIVSLLDHFVRSPQATSLLLGMQRDQDTRDIEVFNPNLHGIYLRDLRLPADVIVLSVKRGGQMIISHGYTRLRLGDVVTMVGTIESLNNVALRLGN